jgi:hypothetical protein
LNKKLWYYEIAGVAFVSVLGTLAHFFFEWSKGNLFVGLFCPVNESTWEHLKLLFFPFFVYSLIEYWLIGKNWKNFWFAKAIAVIIGMVFIVVGFYTYSGVLGRNFMIADIALFFISVFLSFGISYYLLRKGFCYGRKWQVMGVLAFVVISALFMLFTFYPPQIHLFWDVSNETYGIVMP